MGRRRAWVDAYLGTSTSGLARAFRGRVLGRRPSDLRSPDPDAWSAGRRIGGGVGDPLSQRAAQLCAILPEGARTHPPCIKTSTPGLSGFFKKSDDTVTAPYRHGQSGVLLGPLRPCKEHRTRLRASSADPNDSQARKSWQLSCGLA